MTTALLSKCVILAGILTQTTSYTFVSPKIFSQSLQPSSRAWSNIVPYPIRAYQPSIPLQYMRYYGDPYYPNNLQNPDYYFPHDSYDDGDYYSNILYYLPTSRRSPYYEPTIMDTVEDLSDYDDDVGDEDGILKSQKDWWLEKNVGPNEDVDIRQLNHIGNLYGSKNTFSKTEPKTNSKNARKNVPKSRYVGIDGFGRKKEQDQVYGNHRPSTKQGERIPVYGKQVHAEYNEDTDAKALRSLMNKPLTREDKKIEEFNLNNWLNGYEKRSTDRASMFKTKENFLNKDKSMNQKISESYIYDEGGQEVVPQSVINEWVARIPTQETSVFDRIRTLLALEDSENEMGESQKSHKLIKRKPPAYKPSTQIKKNPSNKDRSRVQSSSTVSSSGAKGAEMATTPSPVSRTIKRSVPAEESNDSSLYQNKDDSLVRQLSAVKNQGS